MEQVNKMDEEMQIDLIEILYALRKRVLILIAALLAGALLAGVYTETMVTPLYRATSTMLVLTKETTLTSLADLQLGSQLTIDYSMLIKSRSVLQNVIDNLDLDMNYRTLEGSVSVYNPESTRILEITVTNPDPRTAKALVDELAEVSSDFISDQMEVSPPKIIEEGEVPTAPISPSLRKNVMLGALAGLALAAGTVVVMTLLDDSIRSEEDIERFLGIPALASIPDRKDYIGGKSKSSARRKRRRRKRR